MESVLPSISVLIANYNGKAHLENCLPSLIAQSYPAHLVEIIVVDNGSTDGSVSFLQQEYSTVRIIQNRSNEGFAKSNNQAAEIATGDYMALINNDMIAKPDWLEQLLATQVHSGAECVAGIVLDWDGAKIDFVDAGMTPFGFATQLHFGESVENLIHLAREKALFFACGGSMLIRRDTFLHVGGFDEDFFCYLEDADLGFRLWVMGYRIFLAPGAITYHRHNGTIQSLPAKLKERLILRNRMFLVYKNYDDILCWKCLAGLIFMMFIDVSSHLQLYITQPEQRNEAYMNLLIHAEAGSDFIRLLPSMEKKRKLIQSCRRRSDHDIIKLMHRPDRHVENLLERVHDLYLSYRRAFGRS